MWGSPCRSSTAAAAPTGTSPRRWASRRWTGWAAWVPARMPAMSTSCGAISGSARRCWPGCLRRWIDRNRADPGAVLMSQRSVNAKRSLRTLVCGAGAFIALTFALNPVFFVIYRLMVFNTVPRDDYAAFLLWLVGSPGGSFPQSPYGYRLLSMVAAAPFYYLLPPLRVTNLPADLTAPYVRATAAIAALSYLSLLLAAALIYRVARDRCGLGRPEGMLAA